jgi:hypothetical protein
MQRDKDGSFDKSHQLSRQHVPDAVSPHEIATILNERGIRFVLIGGHLLGYLTGSPRATVDVDVIVSSGQVVKAVEAIRARFPQFTVQDLVHNVRFNSGAAGKLDVERIDVVRADNGFFKRILEQYSTPLHSGGTTLHVPTIEAAVALKFAAAVSPNRGDESRPQDRLDLLAIVRNHMEIDEAALDELGELVYPGGGRELLDFVTAVHAGRSPAI